MIDVFPGLSQIARPNLGIEIAGRRSGAVRVEGKFLLSLTRGRRTLRKWEIPNGATTVGLNYLINASFRAQSQITTWYCGVIAASGFTGVSSNDTMSSHTGWGEFTGYSESVRQTWTAGVPSGGVTVNGTAMTFTINSNSSAQGVFITSDSTKTGTSGTLWATAVEASPFSVTSGVALNVIYQVTLTPVS